MKLSCIILSWETLKYTQRCITSVMKEKLILASSGHDLKVIVVDNGSLDGTQEWLKEYPKYYDELVQLDKNYGACIARNRGLEKVEGDYVYFMDCDLRAIPCSFNRLLDYIVKDPKIGVLGLASWHMSPDPRDETGVMPELEVAECQRSPYTGLALAYTQYGIWRMSMFREHGIKFVEEYPFDRGGHGYEDDDIGGQIEQAGFDIRAVMNVCYLHAWHASGGPMKRTGIDDKKMTKEREKYVVSKWKGIFTGQGPKGIHPGM